MKAKAGNTIQTAATKKKTEKRPVSDLVEYVFIIFFCLGWDNGTSDIGHNVKVSTLIHTIRPDQYVLNWHFSYSFAFWLSWDFDTQRLGHATHIFFSLSKQETSRYASKKNCLHFKLIEWELTAKRMQRLFHINHQFHVRRNDSWSISNVCGKLEIHFHVLDCCLHRPKSANHARARSYLRIESCGSLHVFVCMPPCVWL